MLKRYHRVFGALFRIVDAGVIAAAWLVSYWLRFQFPIIEVTKGFPKFATYAALSPLVILLWLFVFSFFRVYHSKRMLRRTDEAYLILKSHIAALILFIAITYLFSDYKYSRGVMIYFAVLGGVSLVAFRLVLRNFLRQMRKRGFNLRHLIVVGEGGSVETLVQRLEKFPELGFRVIGAVVHENSTYSTVAGKPVLGRFSDISSILSKFHPDQLLIALPRFQSGELDRILKEVKDEMVDLQLVPDVHEYVTLGCEVEDFDGFPIVNLNDSPLEGWAVIGKRLTDIILSAMALIILSPVLLAVAVAIKLTSKGPVLYRQERMGLDGSSFQMFKFRSMKTDAEVQTGAVWAVENDPRRTALGTFLRKTSLDELPQFWNVLRGDMSLVGPRPERPVFVNQFRKDIPNYMLRHKVKAGITGWAQVNGWRGNTSLERRIECDLYYIRNWSYVLDIKILLLTFWKGFVNRNAY